jgi:hypothetical protein
MSSGNIFSDPVKSELNNRCPPLMLWILFSDDPHIRREGIYTGDLLA